MRSARRIRKVAFGAGLVLVTLLVLLAALPLWFPWLLRPVAAWAGAHYGRYERLGYQRLAITDATWTNRTLRVHAGRVELFVPSVYFWQLRAHTNAPAPFVSARDWSVDSHPTGKGKSVWQEASGWVKPVHEVPRWIPAARLTNGIVRVPGATIRIPEGIISNQVLRATVDLPQPFGPTLATLSLATPNHYHLLATSAAPAVELRAEIATGPDGIRLEGQGTWLQNPVKLSGFFARTGSLPRTASIAAPQLRVPADLLRLPGYNDLEGSLAAHWDNGQFGIDLSAHADPVVAETNLPALNLVLRAHGDTNAAVIDSAALRSPSLSADLSREVKLHRYGPLLTEPARLRVSIDLDKQPWLPLQGRLHGEAFLSPGEGRIPSSRFHVSGQQIATRVVETRDLDIEGVLNWPSLSITGLKAVLDDDSRVSAEGVLEVTAHTVHDGRFRLEGPLLNRWLPAGYSLAQMEATGTLSGPLKAPLHGGRATASGVVVPGLKPLALAADWEGTLTNLSSFLLAVTSGGSTLQAAGRLVLQGPHLDLDLQQLTLRSNQQPVLSLERAVNLWAELPGTNRPLALHTDLLRWYGPGRDVALEGTLDWPRSGQAKVTLQNVGPGMLSDFLAAPMDPLLFRHAAVTAQWDRGPLEASVDLEAERHLQGQPWSVRCQARLDAAGLVLTNTYVASQGRDLATANGFLPVLVHVATEPHWVVRTNASMAFHARALPGVLEEQLSALAGLRLTGSQISADLSGTLASPQGQILLSASQAILSGGKTNLPPIEKIEARVRLDHDVARLEHFGFRVGGQPVVIQARLPLGAAFWAGLAQKRMPDWSGITANLQVEDADLAVVSRLLPNFVAPQGLLNANLWLWPGFHFGGELTVDGARTPPFGTLGSFRDIRLHLAVEDRSARLQTAVARIGGAGVSLAGHLDLSGTNWWRGETPPFQVTLHGTNVALARQPEAIVRADLNLAVTKTNGAPPLISGTATLKDSYYLSDLHDLVPGQVATPKARPPYFSIDDPGLGDWRLGVHVTGDRFLNVRSPLFTGQVSTSLRLNGTLKDPIALGDVRTDSGAVRFPFATLDVQQGLVTLGSDDPYRPRLKVSATTRQYGYDLRMEVTGPVDAPVLQFSSTPPLSSEQIVLMVTAGELPRGGMSLSAQQRAEGLAMFLARDFLARLGFGDGSDQRLILRSGEDVSQQGTPTYDVEFKMTKRWSLTGEYDRFGDFNAGVKWQVYSK